jgi:phosphoribosylanthranilate isomerase
MAKIKICGLSRGEDIEYANEAQPDYIGFVFAESRRKISPEKGARLRSLLDGGIIPVGVFVNAPIENIAALYSDDIIDIAQLHGDEDSAYINKLKEATAADKRGVVKIIKAIKVGAAPPENAALKGNPSLHENAAWGVALPESGADYYLFDNGGGTGKTFDWATIKKMQDKSDTSLPTRPWFLAGGIGLHNIAEALSLGSFGIDISSGAETDGVKDREKMIALTSMVRKGKAL